MPPDPLDEEDYASSEDSDFSPDAVPDRASSPDSDVEAAHATKSADTAVHAAVEPDAEDAGFENSGDEAVIGRGKKRRRKHGRAGSDAEDGDGAGAFVKTRSQRAQEKAERRTAAVQGPVTVDVDALWAQMNAPSGQQEQERLQKQQKLASLAEAAATAAAAAVSSSDAPQTGGDVAKAAPESSFVKIKRTYNFAGKVHTEEKTVPRDSAEAKLYLASLAGGATDDAALSGTDDKPQRLPPRKAFRSAFEPVLDPLLVGAQGGSRRADLDLGLRVRLQARERAAQDQARKLNTIEKSRMDWAGYVDKEGIQDELALAGKAKGSFADRQLFLARSETKREEEARRARLANKT